MGPVVLHPRDRGHHDEHRGPAFVDATFDPDHGLSLFQARGRLPDGRSVDLLQSSQSFGGAILLPFANDVNTGMVVLPPDADVTWAVRWQLLEM
jgi:hypothetical protein